ncbi:MAG: AbrB/MazE/SpoVT family DNA-binding domain-containing protein [Bryobacteraceae bacterium]
MPEATLSADNRIVIPKEAREALGIKPGDKLLVVTHGSRMIVLQKPESPHAAILGLSKRPYPKDYLKKERESWD